jgi:hypothetical protein
MTSSPDRGTAPDGAGRQYTRVVLVWVVVLLSLYALQEYFS